VLRIVKKSPLFRRQDSDRRCVDLAVGAGAGAAAQEPSRHPAPRME
jgi:hypothetical protein